MSYFLQLSVEKLCNFHLLKIVIQEEDADPGAAAIRR